MKIKVSSLHSLLHDKSSLNLRSKSFLNAIEQELNNELIISDINDYDCDIKLIFIETGGSEMFFKKQYKNLKEPFYFLTSGEDNSLAATLEILTYLKSINKHGEIIHGSIKYIASRIKELSACKKHILEGQRYGVIGDPSDWLIASIPENTNVKEHFGADLVKIELKELIETFKSNKEKISIDSKGFNKNAIEDAEKVYQALKSIIEKYNLDGFTLRCFDLLSTIKTTGCLALAKLNQEGFIATCEGDVMAMLSMAIARKISNESSFQANPSRINVDDNTILFAHCTVPLDMLKSYTYKTHFESGIGVAIKGELFENEVTVLRISKDLTNYFVSKGKIIKNLSLDNLCRTQILIQLDTPVSTLLTNPCGNHHIIFYGDYTDKIKELLK